MSWPKGRPRPRKVASATEVENAPSSPIDEPPPLAQEPAVFDEPGEEAQGVKTPPDWRKGALLNVRNHGEYYVITILPEEYDSRYEDRCIKFTNLGECQAFVSAWYAREHHDPRAR